jgi:hypothetical protein
VTRCGPAAGGSRPLWSGTLLPMLLTTILAKAAEETNELPVDPIVFGLAAFVILGVLMLGVLAFGKGRPHS